MQEVFWCTPHKEAAYIKKIVDTKEEIWSSIFLKCIKQIQLFKQMGSYNKNKSHLFKTTESQTTFRSRRIFSWECL